MRQRASANEDEAYDALQECISGITEDNLPATTDEITRRFLKDGFVLEDVHELISLGEKKKREIETKMKQVATAPVSTCPKDRFRRRNRGSQATAPPQLAYPAPVIANRDLPNYLRKKLKMMPVVVITSESGLLSGDWGCMLLICCGGFTAAKMASEHLREKLRLEKCFAKGFNVVKEGQFIKLIVDAFSDQEDVDRLMPILQGLIASGFMPKSPRE